MKVEQVDAFYLRLPAVHDVGDGSQDGLLIRVVAGGHVGWGECEAAPLPTIAALVAPLSHSACHPVLDSILGAELDGPESIRSIHRSVRAASADLPQAAHALSGIDIALWDLLGKREGAPVWSFIGHANNDRLAYASRLFGDTPEETFARARDIRDSGFRAAKFGWGPIARSTLEADAAQLESARAGLGPDVRLLVDTGCVFDHDVERAAARIPLFQAFDVGWWEEPFANGALAEYAALAGRSLTPLAGGEGSSSADQGCQYVSFGRVGFIQIDAGRVGGITDACRVAEFADRQGAVFVNHTFTSNLALSASLTPFADHPAGRLAEVPFAASELADAIGGPRWPLDSDGFVRLPGAPGLGVEPELGDLKPYIQDVEIRWNGRPLYRSPVL